MSFLGVFLLCAVIEFLYARWAIAVQHQRAALAGLMAGLLQTPVVVGLLTVVMSGWYIIPNILGHAVGSYVTVRWIHGSQSNGVQSQRGNTP